MIQISSTSGKRVILSVNFRLQKLLQGHFLCFLGSFLYPNLQHFKTLALGPNLYLMTSQDQSLQAYITLAQKALSCGKLLWPSRPKHHAPRYSIIHCFASIYIYCLF